MTESVESILKTRKNIVFITGTELFEECGSSDPWSTDNFYRTAKKYNVGPEALLSAGEYSSRKERFYNYYREAILSNEVTPNETYKIIKEIDSEGRLEACISTGLYGLERMSGIKTYIEISGNIHDNYCMKCHKKYSLEYVKNSVGVPVCKECKKALRPNIRLLGEKVNNTIYTKAAEACNNADAVIVLGASLYSTKVQYITGHYKGQELILFTKEAHYADKFADSVIYGNITNNLIRYYRK